MKRAYLDSCAIIYLIEGAPAVHDLVKARLAALEAAGSTALATSALARLECRVKPLRENQSPILAQFDGFLGSANMTLYDVTTAVIDKATELRAKHGFKIPDAIHLATAIVFDCGPFVTGDTNLARCTEMAVEVLPIASVQAPVGAPSPPFPPVKRRKRPV